MGLFFSFSPLCLMREELTKVVEKARRLDPRMQDSSLNLLAEGIAYNVMGRYEKAMPVLKRYVPRNPNFLMAHFHLTIAYIELGQEADARAEAAEVLRINPQFILGDPRLRMPRQARWTGLLRACLRFRRTPSQDPGKAALIN
jgi:tetratricopeptide (TPR) repeat protein